MNSKYVYPQLPAIKDFYFFRYRGSGFANCLFVVARAYVFASQNGCEIINPAWINFSLGPYLRNEKDKRHYWGIVNRLGITGIRKLLLLTLQRKTTEESYQLSDSDIVVFNGLGNYFKDILFDYSQVSQLFNSLIKNNVLKKIEQTKFNSIIGIHIRLGDYSDELRTKTDWYVQVVNQINEVTNDRYSFFLFSDGTLDELAELLNLRNVQKVFFGNAFADILALSRCRLIVASDSTFSAWGAYLGQVPVIFPRRHFGQVLADETNEFVNQNKSCNQLTEFLLKVLK